MSSVAAARAVPLKSAIASEIRRRIVEGIYAPGQRISDKELTLELGASRTPVREALLDLKSAGLVVMRPQHGTFVFEASADETRDICELRGIYESGALRLSLGRAPERVAAPLKSCITKSAAALRSGDLAAFEKLDRQFHETLIDLSANPYLIDAYRLIADKVNVLRHLLPQTRERMAKALTQHRRIARLAENRDVEKACAELASHVRNVHRQLQSRATTCTWRIPAQAAIGS